MLLLFHAALRTYLLVKTGCNLHTLRHLGLEVVLGSLLLAAWVMVILPTHHVAGVILVICSEGSVHPHALP